MESSTDSNGLGLVLHGLIIFDLDDTLVDTSEVFHQSRRCFISLMVSLGINATDAIKVFEEIDTRNFVVFGVAPERYASSMRSACEKLLNLSNLDSEPELAVAVRKCAQVIRTVYPQPIAGAVDLLTWAQSRFELALLTRGIEDLQLAKLDSIGFRHYFRTIQVVNTKGKAEFASLISELDYEPQQCWVVGDSIKSDINPGLAVGANCIHYEHKHPFYHWQQEHTEVAIGSHFHAISLAEVQEHLADWAV